MKEESKGGGGRKIEREDVECTGAGVSLCAPRRGLAAPNTHSHLPELVLSST